MNIVGSEIEWLFYHLWIKTGQTAPKFPFSVPDTVFYKLNKPNTWYFTSKDGYILKKNKFNVNQKVVHEKFTKRLQTQDQVVATAYYYRKDSSFLDIHMDHIGVSDFRTFMFFTETLDKPQVLQKFVICKQAKNSMIRCHWSPSFSIVEKQTNQNNFFDTKLPLNERVPTFEGTPSQSKSENIVSTGTIDDINNCVRAIQQHLLENSKINLLGGKFYFKQDKSDNLVLLFATNIKVDKVEVHTNNKQEMRLRMFNPQGPKFKEDLPAVGATQNGSSSRPLSQYGRQKNRLKSLECLFCEQNIETGDGFDITFSQVLKMYQFYEDNTELLLELTNSPDNFSFNKQFQNSLLNCKGKVPEPILKVFPNLSIEKYNQKKSDPLFLYDNFKVCNDCYQFVKFLISHINSNQEERDKEKNILKQNMPLNKNMQFQQIALSQSESVHSDQPYLHKQSLKRFNLNNTDLKQVYTKLPPQQSQTSQTTTDQLQQNPLQQKSQSRLKRTSSAKGSFSDRLAFNSARQSDTATTVVSSSQQAQQQEQKPVMMMFSKVEAGKEVAKVVKIQKDQSSDQFEIQEERINLEQSADQSSIQNISQSFEIEGSTSHKRNNEYSSRTVNKRRQIDQRQNQLNFHTLYNKNQRPSTSKDGQKRSLPKINWEKEYQQAVKVKTKQVAGEIFDTCNKIENGKFIPSKQLSDSLDIKIPIGLNNDISTNIQKQANIRSNYDSGQSFTVVQKQIQESNIFDQNSMLDIEKEYQIQQSGSALVPIQKLSSDEQKIRISYHPNERQGHKGSSRRILAASEQKSIKLIKENSQQTQNVPNSQKARILSNKRIRPMSSKPPLHNQNQMKLEIDWSLNQQHKQGTAPFMNPSFVQQVNHQPHHGSQTLPQRQPNMQKRLSESNYKPRNKSATKPTKFKPSSEKKANNTSGSGGGLFDFQKMTGNDIKHIADNADQLIQIIQNIKETVQPQPKGIKRSMTDINEPCLEEENEEDYTCENIPEDTERTNNQENTAGKDNGQWWD